VRQEQRLSPQKSDGAAPSQPLLPTALIGLQRTMILRLQTNNSLCICCQRDKNRQSNPLLVSKSKWLFQDGHRARYDAIVSLRSGKPRHFYNRVQEHLQACRSKRCRIKVIRLWSAASGQLQAFRVSPAVDCETPASQSCPPVQALL
jgi:hypothetical protein